MGLAGGGALVNNADVMASAVTFRGLAQAIMGLRRQPAWWLGGLLLVGLAAERLAMLTRAAPTDFDDAYMYLRYADHLLAGHGVAWNAGEGPVFGVTRLLHLGVVAVLRWLFPTAAA